MPEPHDAPRRYDDTEVERILSRAADLESQRPPASGEESGMTLAEIEQIGTEAGLRPDLLRRAARELDRGIARRGDPTAILLGAPAEVELERDVEGEVTREQLESLIPALRRVDGMGHAAIVGNVLSWQSADPGDVRVLGVTVSSSRGRTHIRIGERSGRLAGALFGGIIGGAGGGLGLGVGLGVGMGALGSAAFAVAFPLVMIGGSYALARQIFRSRHRERVEILIRLMDRLVEELEASRGPEGPGRIARVPDGG